MQLSVFPANFYMCTHVDTDHTSNFYAEFRIELYNHVFKHSTVTKCETRCLDFIKVSEVEAREF